MILPVKFHACIFAFLCIFLVLNQYECRHLPTRGHGDNLDKLRELMYQILESSNENEDERLNSNPYFNVNSWSKQQQQQQQPNLFDISNISPQLIKSSKIRYGLNGLDNSRMY